MGRPLTRGLDSPPLCNVLAVQASKYAFTSLHKGGVLHSWGENFYGGKLPTSCERSTGAKEVQSTHSAFAALYEDQTVCAWGNARCGGDAGKVQQELWGILWIQSNSVSFFALRADLTVIAWGETTAVYEHKVDIVPIVTEENYKDCLRSQLEDITDKGNEIEEWWSERA